MKHIVRMILQKWKWEKSEENKIEKIMWLMYISEAFVFLCVIGDIYWALTGVRHTTKAML